MWEKMSDSVKNYIGYIILIIIIIVLVIAWIMINSLKYKNWLKTNPEKR